MAQETTRKNGMLISHVGGVEIDWPRSIGYFGGVIAATSLGLMEPPIAILIAAVPFVKMLNQPMVPGPVRLTAQVIDGAAQPLGSQGQGTIRLQPRPSSGGAHAPVTQRLSILAEARQVASRRTKARANGATSE